LYVLALPSCTMLITRVTAIPKKPVLAKRASSFTEEERESARQFRRNALKGQGWSLWNI
jgi:hypothetical protein